MRLDESTDAIVRAGFLGILYFAAAFLLQNITRRMLRSEALAQERGRSIVELEQLNHQIIQRMRTGIIVSDAEGRIRTANLPPVNCCWASAAIPRDCTAPENACRHGWSNGLPIRTYARDLSGRHLTPEVQANFTRMG